MKIENGESLIDCLRYADMNGDQELDFNEFLTATIDANLFINPSFQRKAFKVFDVDNSGYLDQKEMMMLVASQNFNDDTDHNCKVEDAMEEFETKNAG